MANKKNIATTTTTTTTTTSNNKAVTQEVSIPPATKPELKTITLGELKPTSEEAFCVKCKSKQAVKNPEKTTMKNGKHALKGTCPICDKTVYKLIKKSTI